MMRVNLAAAIGRVAALTAVWALGAAVGVSQSMGTPGKEESRNMRLVGHDDLQGRAAYKGEIHKQNGRYIAYIGHHPQTDLLNPMTGKAETSGTSLVDVTDPKNPKYLHHIPAPLYASGEQVCAGDDLPSAKRGSHYMLRRTTSTNDIRHEMWDVTEPREPKFLGSVQDQLVSIHKAWWDCSTGMAYLPSQPKGWHGRGMSVFDLSNPAKPKFIRNFGVPGSQPSQDPAGRRMTELHEVLYLEGRLYMAYGTSTEGILQILDNEKLLKGDPADPYDPLNPTDKQLLYPEIGRLDSPSFAGVHTAFPLLRMDLPKHKRWPKGTPRDFLVSVPETTADGCKQPVPHLVAFVDITDPKHPYPVSSFEVPESEGNYCDRGGRFGPHATNWDYSDVYRNRIVWISYFNAGVRGVDIRDPYHPVEVAYYIPAVTAKTIKVDGKSVISTNNADGN